MAVIEFVRHYTDHSTDAGYRFEFHCDRCGTGYPSGLAPNRLGTVEGLLHAGGRLLGRIGEGAYEVQRAVGGPQYDHALHTAIGEIRPQFARCDRCGQWVCRGVCWDAERGQCQECATA